MVRKSRKRRHPERGVRVLQEPVDDGRVMVNIRWRQRPAKRDLTRAGDGVRSVTSVTVRAWPQPVRSPSGRPSHRIRSSPRTWCSAGPVACAATCVQVGQRRPSLICLVRGGVVETPAGFCGAVSAAIAALVRAAGRSTRPPAPVTTLPDVPGDVVVSDESGTRCRGSCWSCSPSRLLGERAVR